LPRHLPGSVDIKDEQLAAVAIKQTTKRVRGEGVLADRVFEQLTQGVEACRINIGQKAAEGRAVGEAIASEESHEGSCKGCQALEKRLQSRLATGGIAKQNGDKVDDVVMTCPSTGQPYLGIDGLEQATLGKMTRQEHHLRKPRGNRRNFLWTALQVHGHGERTHNPTPAAKRDSVPQQKHPV
jgi:hypothetical protein